MRNFKNFEIALNFANYICVSQNYLKQYCHNTVETNDLKGYSCGHWGTCPSINFLYAHLIDFFKRHNLKANIVVGTGHSGSAVNANLWLCGQLYNHRKKYSLDKKGLNNLIADFGKTTRTEVNPFYPSTIYDGGELGYSLAFAYGYTQINDLDILPCIIGDGECETGTLSASWQLNKILNNKKVLPIINLNGLKMCSNSFLSGLTDKQIINLFSSYGYKVHITDNNHKKFYKVLEKIYSQKNTSHMIVFKSKKGFGAYQDDDFQIEGNLISHKNPLSKITNSNKKAKIVQDWLDIYKKDFFDNDKVKKELVEFYNYNFYTSEQKLTINKKAEYKNSSTVFEAINYCLQQYIKNNNLFIVSPDELISNKLENLLQYKNNFVELLSENVLQGFYQGLTQAGNLGIYVSYESFAPVFISMVSQYLKYLYQATSDNKRYSVPSLTYLLTSTAFENTFSHQNPEFVASLLNKEYNNINVYYPATTKQSVQTLNYCFSQKNAVNVVTASKSCKLLQEVVANNIDFIEVCYNEDAKINLCATGDYNLNQMLSVKSLLSDLLPNIKINLFYISNIKILSEKYNCYNKDLSNKIFDNSKITIYTYMGYSSVIRNLFYNQNTKLKIYGYQDKSNVSGCTENKFRYNKMGKLDVILYLLEQLYLNKIITKKKYVKTRLDIVNILGQYYDKKLLKQ